MSAVVPIALPELVVRAGYTRLAFGPDVFVGENWFPFDFFGTDPDSVEFEQHADGSVTILGPGGSNDYGAQLCTARWAAGHPLDCIGTVFSGGAYFEATFSFTGQPTTRAGSFWTNDVESMACSSSGHLLPRQWPGQPDEFGNWIEVDIVEHNTGDPFSYGITMHNWFGMPGETNDTHAGPIAGSPVLVPAGTDFAEPHQYGFLWVPATQTRRGYARWFFDRQPIGNRIEWDLLKWTATPPPVLDSTAFGILDQRHHAMILGCGDAANPVTVYGVEVWQR